MIKKYIKFILLLSLLSITCLCLMACGKDYSDEVYPEYLLEGARDNGFVASYRAYFAIENGNVNKISETKYDNLIYKDSDDHYEIVPEEYYSFEINAKTNNPSDWKYEQNRNNDKMYDTEILKNQLLDMNVSFWGNIYIHITKFDEYILIEVVNMNENNAILDSKYAIFYNNEMLQMENDIDLSSIRKIYKYNEDK